MLGLGAITKKVFGTPNDRKVKATRPIVEKINALEPEFEALSDEGLKQKTEETGEGKTLVATFPAYLNALTGEGVHVVTVNDYLAKRDAEWMSQVFGALGLTTGVVYPQQPEDEKKAAYQCDVTYATNNELGFDYLRDNMKSELAQMNQRGHNFAIVDPRDSGRSLYPR